MQKLRITFLKQETLSPTSFAILSSIFSDTRPQQWQGVGSHSGANKGIHTPFLNQSPCPTPFLMLNLVARSTEMSKAGRTARNLRPSGYALLLTSVIRVSLLHLKLYGLNKQNVRNA